MRLLRRNFKLSHPKPLTKLSDPFADLKYDAFRAIRFREDRRLFADGSRAFQMELLPPGHHFQDRIEINLVAADGRVQPVAFVAERPGAAASRPRQRRPRTP